ncbi:MAG: RAMP superfamily CRISPR-associated protein [Promethearchaeota archaeon]
MRIILNLKMVPETAILIAGGTSISQMGIDKTTVRNSNNKLIIPASTLKGKIRDECSRILRGLDYPGILCEPPVAENMCPQPSINKSSKIEYCPICEIFGSPWKKGSLVFSDLICQEALLNEEELQELAIKVGIVINRQTRITRDKTLYYMETSPQHFKPEFANEISIYGTIPSRKYAALLFCGIESIANIGSSKSIGLGWLKKNKIEIKLNSQNYCPQKSDLEEWKNG